MQKAYGYLRVSSKGQLRGDGPERQRDKIKQYCRANNMEIVDWFEESETGTKEERFQFARLMVDLEKNSREVRTVVIERLDRLARDVMVQEGMIRDFRKMDVQLISVDEGLELASSDPSRKLIRQMFGAIAEYDKDMLVLRLRAARLRKRLKAGKCEGAKAYGEDSPEEQHLIRRIRLLRRRRKGKHPGMTYKQIADLLNEEGIRTKKGKEWRAQSVYHAARFK